MRWSVGIEADAGRVLSREEVVELADAVADSDGMASGIGSSRYGVTLIVQAEDRDEAVATCGEIAALFDRHAGKEEAGVFAELSAEGLAADVVRSLEEDHRRIELGLALLAAGDTTSLGRVLADLVDHAEREDSDLFPAALQLLPNDAWDRIRKVHQEGAT